MAGTLKRTALNKEVLNVKTLRRSSTKTGAYLMGRHIWRDKTQSTFYMSEMKDTYSHHISLAWSDIAICCYLEHRCLTLCVGKPFLWAFKSSQCCALFRDDCLNCSVLKAVKSIADKVRVSLFNNPTQRHRTDPI